MNAIVQSAVELTNDRGVFVAQILFFDKSSKSRLSVPIAILEIIFSEGNLFKISLCFQDAILSKLVH